MSVLALSGSQKTGILVVAAIFIGFALASAFLLPRRNPDFPGRHVTLFVVVSVALFIAMMSAMVVLAVEDEEEGEASAAAGEVQETGGEPAGGSEDTTGETETQAPAEAQGDPAAGKEVFASAGCGGCHALEDAGASGAVGPNLDDSAPDLQLVLERVTNGSGPMPAFKDQLSEDEIQDVAAYVVQATGGS
ncbi:MAG TPA: c-type cytochrome [Gaiellaceae bacterium]|nr:c-type cytochrome [Gaiellaceae bacterium]